MLGGSNEFSTPTVSLKSRSPFAAVKSHVPTPAERADEIDGRRGERAEVRSGPGFRTVDGELGRRRAGLTLGKAGRAGERAPERNAVPALRLSLR